MVKLELKGNKGTWIPKWLVERSCLENYQTHKRLFMGKRRIKLYTLSLKHDPGLFL
jgi:hypothetical protein